MLALKISQVLGRLGLAGAAAAALVLTAAPAVAQEPQIQAVVTEQVTDASGHISALQVKLFDLKDETGANTYEQTLNAWLANHPTGGPVTVKMSAGPPMGDLVTGRLDVPGGAPDIEALQIQLDAPRDPEGSSFLTVGSPLFVVLDDESNP